MCLAAKELGVQVYASQTADESLSPLLFGLDRLSWYTMCAHVYVYYCISWKSFPFATKLHYKLQREAVVEPWSHFKLVVLTKFVFLEIHPNGSNWWMSCWAITRLNGAATLHCYGICTFILDHVGELYWVTVWLYYDYINGRLQI